MYRYGDGSPFPLDENFIETLTSAVEACTNAFLPLAELDNRRLRAKEARREAEAENARLAELEAVVNGALAPYLAADRRANATQQVAQKLSAAAKQSVIEAKRQVDTRVQGLEAQAAPRTVTDAVVRALSAFFAAHQLPKSQWIMSWDARGAECQADAVVTAGRLAAAFVLSPEPYRAPIRVDQLADGVIVHMMKKGMFGKAKPAPVDLGKYVVVAFEHTARGEHIVTLKESATKASTGLRFAVMDRGATWVTITMQGDAEGEPNELDSEDVAPVRTLADRAYATLKDLINRRTLVELSLANKPIAELEEPRIVPLELLAQLTPLARTIRDKSRMSGELVLKRDVGDGRREELFVPRATLAAQFARLPVDYRRPFEDMGINGEATQPAVMLPRAPAKTQSDEPTNVDLDND